MESETVVLIPAYNAEETISELLQRVKNILPTSPVIVVNDGSTDATAERARAFGAEVLTHTQNMGKGAALRTGFETIINRTPYTFVLTMDADLQHLPEDAVHFFTTQKSTRADIILGTRKRRGTGMPLHRQLSNCITSFLVSARTRTRVLDSQCGYRLIHRKVVESVSIRSHGYEAETEFLVQALLKGFTVAHAPITTVYGTEKSYMKNWKTTVTFLDVLLTDYS